MLKPTEAIGQSLMNWDNFYSANYSWLYELLEKEENTTPDEIKDELERLLVKLLLNKPEVIVSGTSESIKSALKQISPRINELVDSENATAIELLFGNFYCAN